MQSPARPTASAAPATRKTSLETTLGLLPILAISTAVATPAFAESAFTEETQQAGQQAPATQVEDVVVVGRSERYTEGEGSAPTLTAPLLNTARTVRIITQKEIEERGATSVEDVLRTTPGVTLGSGEGGTPFGVRPYIRGFEAAFSMAVDGVRTRGRTTYEAFNLESIEVNMGSDGVTAGAGSAAGSISLNSKEPQAGSRFHNVSIMGGDASQGRVTYDGNLSLTDALTARLNLLWQESGVPGSQHVEDNKRGVAPAIAWRIGEGTLLTLKGQYVESSGTPGGRVPYANAAWNNNRTLAGWADYGWGVQDDPYMPLGHIDRNNFYGVLGRDFREATNASANLKLEHALNEAFTLTTVLSWIETETQMAIMRPSVSVAGGRFVVARNGNGGVRYSNRGTDTGTFYANLRGGFDLGGVRHSVSLGVEAARDRVRNGSSPTATTTPNQTPLFDPNPNDPFTLSGSFGPLGTPTTTDTRAIYAFDTITLNDRWLINGGVRIEDFEIDTGALRWGDVLTDYQLGVMYKPLPNATVYLSYNTTSSPPGACANQGGSNCPADSLDGATAATEAEKTANMELGVKWDLFGGALSLSGALYSTEKDNARVADEDGEYTLNTGNQRGRGIDLGVAGRVNDRWSLVAGYTYLDAEVVDGGPNATEANTGNRPINTAEHTFSFWSTYRVTDRFMIGGGANYVSLKYVNPENTYAVPEYWRADLMASYRFTDRVAVQVNATNLFDEVYYDSSHVGSFATLQPGRSLTARLNLSF